MRSKAKTPAELGPEVMARIPVRNNHDSRYFSDLYQALPKNGYAAVFAHMFNHTLIEVQTDTDYFDTINPQSPRLPRFQCGRTYFTGPIDEYFAHLGWQVYALPLV